MFGNIIDTMVKKAVQPYISEEKEIDGKKLSEFRFYRRVISAYGRVEAKSKIEKLLIEAAKKRSVAPLEKELVSIGCINTDLDQLRTAVRNEWGFEA